MRFNKNFKLQSDSHSLCPMRGHSSSSSISLTAPDTGSEFEVLGWVLDTVLSAHSGRSTFFAFKSSSPRVYSFLATCFRLAL